MSHPSKDTYRAIAQAREQHRWDLAHVGRPVALAEAKITEVNHVERVAHGERAFTNWVQARVQRLASGEADFCDVLSFMAEVQTLEIINDLRYRR